VARSRQRPKGAQRTGSNKQKNPPARRPASNRPSIKSWWSSRRNVTVVAVIVAVVVVSLVVALVVAGHSRSASSGPIGPEGIPLQVGTLLAPASTAANGETVDGIQCNSSEQLVYHVHSHVAVFVNGVLRPIPAGIGIVQPVPQETPNGRFYSATQCYYWLHVHAQDGVIHIESPTLQTYTLSNSSTSGASRSEKMRLRV
jgi:hypothetical protein